VWMIDRLLHREWKQVKENKREMYVEGSRC